MSRSQFQDAAAKLNDGVIPDGADPGIVARKAGLNAGVAPMKGIQVDQLGQGMQKGSIEVIAVIGSDPTAGHTVNVVSFKVADRLNMFGGGNTPFLKTSTMQVWNPISATVHRLSQSILKLEFIRY